MITRNLFKYLSLIISFWLPSIVFGGGVSLYEIGTSDLRLASAGWSARAEDPSTLFTNPAGMTRLCGKQIEAGAQPIFVRVHFKPNSHTDVSGSDGQADIWLPSGSLFAIYPFNEKFTFGVGSLGYFGSDLVYNHHWVGRYYVQKALMEGLSLIPAAAYRINCHWSIGAGANIMYGFMKTRAAVRDVFDEGSDGYFNMHDYHYGFGGVFGILYEPNCHTRFGLQYLTPVRLSFKATPEFHNLGPLLYDALLSTGIIGSKVDVHVNVPQSLMLSAYHDLNACWSIMGNLGWQQWSRFERVTVNLNNLDNTSLASKVKYQDTWHVALGAEWHFRKNLTFSSGVAYDSSAISNKERTLDFPIGQQWRFGTGARWVVSEKLTIDLSSELQWQGNIKCTQDSPVGGHVSGTFQNTYALFFGSDIIYKF